MVSRAHWKDEKDDFIKRRNEKTKKDSHNRKIIVTFATNYLHGD